MRLNRAKTFILTLYISTSVSTTFFAIAPIDDNKDGRDAIKEQGNCYLEAMTQTAAITEAITTLLDAENRFGFVRVEDEQFFTEWYEVLRRRYLYHRAVADLLEGTVILLLVSPILALSGFYDPPFRIKAESSVELVLNDGEEILRGRIDVLVLQDQFWVMVLESKKTTLSVWSGNLCCVISSLRRVPSRW
jgi:hypothetical protein